MANSKKPRVTSSSNRSTRSTTKPVTKGQNPQRANRQKVSNASVTSSQQRGNRVKTSTARVTSNAPREQGAALKQAAQVRRGAKAASQRMSGVLKAAKTARDVLGVVKNVTRGGAFAAGLQATNTAKGTLSEARQKYGAKAMPQKQGPSQKTTQSSFNKKTFDQAFKAARTSGAKEFTWRGKRYNTKLRGE